MIAPAFSFPNRELQNSRKKSIEQKLLLDAAVMIPVSTVSPNRILAHGYARLVAEDDSGAPIKVAF